MNQKIKGEAQKLDAKINKFKGHKAIKKRISNQSFGVSVELFAGILTGGVIGFYLDKFFNTKMIFFLICLTLGMLGALYNIYRLFKKK